LNLAATLGLLVLLITGVWLVRTHDLGPVPLWLKVSLGLFVLAGAILGIMRAVIRRALAATPAARPIYLRRVRYETFALTLLVTAIVTLMTVK
jgi:uncharacterized membrane protein